MSAKSITVGDKLQLRLDKIVNGGACLAHSEDGLYFVYHGLPGETVIAQVTSVNKKFSRADVIEVLDPSPHRITPKCRFSGALACGGCDFQHVELSHQRELKREIVRQCLSFIGNIDMDFEILALTNEENGFRWRNRVKFAIGEDGSLGMRKRYSHDVVKVTDCLISQINIQDLPRLDNTFSSGDDLELLFDQNIENAIFYTLSGNNQSGGKKRTGLITKDPVQNTGLAVSDTSAGDNSYRHFKIRNHTYRVSPFSFFQIHKDGAEALVNYVTAEIGSGGNDKIADLYCGVGLFTLPVAATLTKPGVIVGIESNRYAASDAKYNLRHLPQAKIWHSPVTASVISQISADYIILDPPRSGAGIKIMTALAQHKYRPKKIIYISCDPATFARDAKTLLSFDWDLEKLSALDMFPMTGHVEILATFIPKK